MTARKPDEPDRLDLRSHATAEDRRRQLLLIFPEIRTEGARVDLDRLRRSLGELVDTGKERYATTWPGKADCLRVVQTPTLATLRPYVDESVNFADTGHAIVEGDNLEVLKVLQKSYLGKVKVICIDPPYNTGNDFIYPDNYAESLRTYLEYTGQVDAEGRRFGTNTEADGRFHSRWLNMMYPRLYLARNLLRQDGVVFVTIDDRELSNLRKVMDEIFGEENFVAQIEWQKRYTRSNNTDDFTSVIDHICVYRRSESFRVSLLPRDEQADARFTNPDNDPRGPWKATPFLNQVGPEKRPNLCYPITNPHTGKTVEPTTKAWRYERTVYDRLLSEDRLFWGKDRTREVPDIKTFLSEVRAGMTPINFWAHDYAGHTDDANREIKELFGEKVFDTPKPSQLMMRMLEHDGSKDGLVLDFFAGSGSTAHAVLAMNRQDGGSRKFLLVQLPEPTGRQDYRTIADITKERVRRVIRKLTDEASGKLNLGATEAPDLGFRVFKLAESNFAPWDAEGPKDSKVLAKQLQLHVDHIREGRTADDLLYEILLKSGFPLATPIESLTIAGMSVRGVAGRALFICLERKLTLDLIRAMADEKPERVVCLDAGFAGNDQLKANAVQIFKTKGVTSFKTV